MTRIIDLSVPLADNRRRAPRWLIDQGVKVVGIDAWGWDVALPVQARQAKGLTTRNWAQSGTGAGHDLLCGCFHGPVFVAAGTCRPRAEAVLQTGSYTVCR